MPTIPPPPPLPISSVINILKHRNSIDQNNNNNNGSSTIIQSVVLWAFPDYSVQCSCYFARTCVNSSPRECSYVKVEPILQTGPTCGLTALSMCLGGSPSVNDLLKKAMALKFSNNGEMFSAAWLHHMLIENLNLANIHAPDRVRAYLYDGHLESEFIREKLKQHSMLLVPYDADKRNHEPTLENGHKAHWALIVGYLIDDTGDYFVFARHGKTKNLGLFSLKHLSDSNSNLNEFKQPAYHPNETFILPDDGGICGSRGLKNKSIVIEGLPNEVVKIV